MRHPGGEAHSSVRHYLLRRHGLVGSGGHGEIITARRQLARQVYAHGYNSVMHRANNVTRLLEARGIRFEAFETPTTKLGAQETAAFLGVSPDLVYKSIVVLIEPSGKPLLVLVPGSQAVDLKKAARVSGAKKVRLPTEREAEELTGLQAGGISPLALLNRGFRVLIDEAARRHPQIHISAGERGLNIKLGVEDLVRLTRARMADVGRPES